MPTTTQPNETHVREILRLLSFGLVKGKGVQKPGEMCVEAAVCAAFGLPHGDDPPCVGEEVRKFKIGLNDKPWSSNKARADGMRELAIAQLGSNEIDQKEFKDLFWFKCGTQLQPLIWRYLATKANREQRLALANKMEKSSSLKECKAHAYNYAHDYDYAYDYAHAYAHAYVHAYAHAYAHAYTYDYAYAHAHAYDAWFSKVAVVGVSVLQELNSPGCQWLHLCK
jgi:hypothetical protein